MKTNLLFNEAHAEISVKQAVHWLRVSAIIAEFNMGRYGCELTQFVSAY